MKLILLFVSILFSLNCFSQADTIPNPEINVVLDRTSYRKDGIINFIPISLTIVAWGNKTFCSQFPSECRYRVSKFEICILDKKGAVKYRTVSKIIVDTKSLNIQNGDKIRINVFEVTRKTSRNENIPFPLEKEFLFKIKK